MSANERGNMRMRWGGNLRIRMDTQRCGQVGALQGAPKEKGGPWTWLLQCAREGAATAGRCLHERILKECGVAAASAAGLRGGAGL